MSDEPSGVAFAIASAKGGVGKTTTAINLGAALSVVAQRSVVVVDVDLAMANVLDFVDLDINPSRDPTLHGVLAGKVEIEDAVYDAPGGIDIVPSGTRLEGYAATDPARLRRVVETLRSMYDIVILDTGAGVSYETILPLGLADAAILVSTPRLAAIRDTKKTKNLADRVGTDVAGIVLVKDGSGRAPDAERIAEFLEVELLGHVPDDGTVPESQDIGLPVLAHDFASSAAKAYWEAAQRVDPIASEFGAERSRTIDASAVDGDMAQFFST